MLSKKMIALVAALFLLSLSATACDEEEEVEEETEEVTDEVEEDDDGEEEVEEDDGEEVTFDSSSEEAMEASASAIAQELGMDEQEFGMMLLGYSLGAAEDAGIDIAEDPDAADEAAQEALAELDGKTAQEIKALFDELEAEHAEEEAEEE